MNKYVDFFEACLAMLELGIDHSDAEQKAHYQDLYSGMTDAAIHELFTRRPDFYPCLAWVMGGHEVARVAAEIAREKTAAEISTLRLQLRTVTDDLTQERDAHARTIQEYNTLEAGRAAAGMATADHAEKVGELTRERESLRAAHAIGQITVNELTAALISERKEHAAEVNELKTQIRALTAYAQSMER